MPLPLPAFLGLFEFAQGTLPALLQFGRDQPVVRVRLMELTLGQPRLITQTFDRLLPRPVDLLFFLSEVGHRSRLGIQFGRGQRREKELHDVVVDRICR